MIDEPKVGTLIARPQVTAPINEPPDGLAWQSGKNLTAQLAIWDGFVKNDRPQLLQHLHGPTASFFSGAQEIIVAQPRLVRRTILPFTISRSQQRRHRPW